MTPEWDYRMGKYYEQYIEKCVESVSNVAHQLVVSFESEIINNEF